MRSRPMRAVVFLKLAGVLQSWADALRRRTGRNLPQDGGAAPVRAPSTPQGTPAANQTPRLASSGPPDHWRELLKNAQGWIDMPAPGSGRVQPPLPGTRENRSQAHRASQLKRRAAPGKETSTGAGMKPPEQDKTISETAHPSEPRGLDAPKPTLRFPTPARKKKTGQVARVEPSADPQYPAARQAPRGDDDAVQPAGQVEPEQGPSAALYRVRFPGRLPGREDFRAPQPPAGKGPSPRQPIEAAPPSTLPANRESSSSAAFETNQPEPPGQPRGIEPDLWKELERPAARERLFLDEIPQLAVQRAALTTPVITEPAAAPRPQYPQAPPTARMEARGAAALFPDLSRAPLPEEAKPAERENIWPDLPADTQRGAEEQISETFRAGLRERLHLQKLDREQRGELWNE